MTVQPRPCTACGALVYDLAHVGTGKLAPIDAEPAVYGNIAINLEEGKYEIVSVDHRAGWGSPLHINHFATCPYANKFRRER